MSQEKDCQYERRDLRMLQESFIANGGDPTLFEEWNTLRKKSEQVAFMWENGLVDRVPRKFLRPDHIEAVLRLIGLRK